MLRKPKILYYSNGQSQKEKAIEHTARRLGADFISISETDCTQTVGYLAKVKGFPVHKTSRHLQKKSRSSRHNTYIPAAYSAQNLLPRLPVRRCCLPEYTPPRSFLEHPDPVFLTVHLFLSSSLHNITNF